MTEFFFPFIVDDYFIYYDYCYVCITYVVQNNILSYVLLYHVLLLFTPFLMMWINGVFAQQDIYAQWNPFFCFLYSEIFYHLVKKSGNGMSIHYDKSWYFLIDFIGRFFCFVINLVLSPKRLIKYSQSLPDRDNCFV